MKLEHFQRIEKTLGLSLPQDYREAVLLNNFPQGIEDEMFSDADRIIRENEKLRASGLPGREWPHHYFIFGGDHEGNGYYLDLSASPAPVYFVDRETGSTELEIETLGQWVNFGFEMHAENLADAAEDQAEQDAIEEEDAERKAAQATARMAAEARRLEYAEVTNTKQWWQFWK